MRVVFNNPIKSGLIICVVFDNPIKSGLIMRVVSNNPIKSGLIMRVVFDNPIKSGLIMRVVSDNPIKSGLIMRVVSDNPIKSELILWAIYSSEAHRRGVEGSWKVYRRAIERILKAHWWDKKGCNAHALRPWVNLNIDYIMVTNINYLMSWCDTNMFLGSSASSSFSLVISSFSSTMS